MNSCSDKKSWLMPLGVMVVAWLITRNVTISVAIGVLVGFLCPCCKKSCSTNESEKDPDAGEGACCSTN